MKSLKNFINEGFKLGKNKVRKTIEHKYFPKNRNELKEILEKRLAEDKDADLNDIDVSKIEDMSNLFENIDPHNIDISEWDVSAVLNMGSMFEECRNFNCDLSNWDVSNVKDMSIMFGNCHNFNSDLSNWNVSNVETMECIVFSSLASKIFIYFK